MAKGKTKALLDQKLKTMLYELDTSLIQHEETLDKGINENFSINSDSNEKNIIENIYKKIFIKQLIFLEDII